MRKWRTADATHIDVRGLTAPQPMVAILKLLQTAADGEVVVAHFDRDPRFLYPELAERGWQADPVPGEEGEVCLRLFRGT
jgi:hypothetical protein